jgi:rubrerythrin
MNSKQFLCFRFIEKEMYEMAFLDKLGETLVSAGKDVSQKAKDLSGSAKLTMDIRAKEDQLEGLYKELGKKYYEAHSEESDEQIVQIKELLAVIEDMKKERLDLKGAMVCPRCGKEISAGDSYCKACGMKLEDEEIIVDAEVHDAPAADDNDITEEVFED